MLMGAHDPQDGAGRTSWHAWAGRAARVGPRLCGSPSRSTAWP